jgi:hypothetical protein
MDVLTSQLPTIYYLTGTLEFDSNLAPLFFDLNLKRNDSRVYVICKFTQRPIPFYTMAINCRLTFRVSGGGCIERFAFEGASYVAGDKLK